MKFDMNAAWNDAVALMRGNREVLAVVAGVFFLLPALAMAVLFADQQAAAMGSLQTMVQGSMLPAAATPPPSAPAWFFAVGIGLLLIEMVGYLALVALMDARRRPTVGEALLTGLKCLLPLIGAVLLFAVVYVVIAFGVGLVMGVIVAAVAAASGSTGATVGLTILLGLALFAVVFWVMVRLSLTLAEIVLGGTHNPATALLRSWRLTKGNGGRLFGFYVLLVIAYLVISMVLFGILLAVGAVLPGQTGGLLVGLASGVIGAVFSVLVTALVAAIYRQMAGPAAQNLSETFE